MRSFSHGYTNDTSPEGRDRVRKRYRGSDSVFRASMEAACLASLHGLLPVPRLVSWDGAWGILERLPGKHGQELIDEGYGGAVMHSAGELLRDLQALRPDLVAALPGDGAVLVHGDFGPQNMLLDGDQRVTGLLDWEFAHRGEPVEDLAWAEWIVRMHHAAHVGLVEALFAGYGSRPAWVARHTAMVERCEQLRARCARERQHAAVAEWARRIEVTRTWEELPLSL